MKIFSLLFILFISTSIFAQSANNQAIENEILVEFVPNATWNQVLDAQPILRKQIALPTAKALSPNSSIHKITIDPQQAKSTEVLHTLAANPFIKNVEINSTVEFRAIPDDPNFDEQWGLKIIGATEVWNESTGGITALGDTIVVAILDSGFDINHEDFAGNIWINQTETVDGLDNDGNGYIDDVNGWDFRSESGNIKPTNHGTSVAGIIGAKGNNDLGITGVNWNIKLMLFSTDRVDQIIAAYEYITDMRRRYNESNGADGAFIVATNASFGQGNTFCTERPIWGSMYDKMGEVGILTGAATDNSNYDVETRGDMPTTCISDFIITTTNVNQEDIKHQSAAYGLESIDLGSPGQDSYSTKTFNEYGGFGGNSAAAPHLTGGIALLYSLPCQQLAAMAREEPRETALLIREVILKGVDPNASLNGITATGGRLNVFNSMVQIQNFCGVTTGDLGILRLKPNPADDLMVMDFETPDFEDYQLDIYNAIGQLVYTDVIQPARFLRKSITINTSLLTRGTYFLVLRGQENLQTKKFIKI